MNLHAFGLTRISQLLLDPFDLDGGGGGATALDDDRSTDRPDDRSQDRGTDRGRGRTTDRATADRLFQGRDERQDAGRNRGRTTDRGVDRTADRGADRGTDSVFDYGEDRRIRLSDGRVVTMREYEQERRSATETEINGRYKNARDMILREAQRLEQLQRSGAAQPGARQPQADPFASLRSMPQVDGNTVANLAAQLQSQGLAPIANLVTSMAQTIRGLQTKMGDYDQRFGTQTEERAQQDFESTLDDHFRNVEVKGLPHDALDPKDPGLREIARNLYLSYEPSSWRPGEFRKMLGEQISGIVKMVRAADQRNVHNSKEKARNFFNGKGNGQPSREARDRFRSPSEIANLARESGFFGPTHTT